MSLALQAKQAKDSYEAFRAQNMHEKKHAKMGSINLPIDPEKKIVRKTNPHGVRRKRAIGNGSLYNKTCNEK